MKKLYSITLLFITLLNAKEPQKKPHHNPHKEKPASSPKTNKKEKVEIKKKALNPVVTTQQEIVKMTSTTKIRDIDVLNTTQKTLQLYGVKRGNNLPIYIGKVGYHPPAKTVTIPIGIEYIFIGKLAQSNKVYAKDISALTVSPSTNENHLYNIDTTTLHYGEHVFIYNSTNNIQKVRLQLSVTLPIKGWTGISNTKTSLSLEYVLPPKTGSIKTIPKIQMPGSQEKKAHISLIKQKPLTITTSKHNSFVITSGKSDTPTLHRITK